MTALSVARPAALRVMGSPLSSLFASTDQIAIEMADLINEVAQDIATSFDWRDLTLIAEFAGNGVVTAFDKPSGYNRMVSASDIQDQATWLWGYCPFATVSEYMAAKNSGFNVVTPGGWIILGGQFQFYPAPSGVATFPYIGNMIVRSADGTPKATFTADDDTFVLSERLLTLGLIWRYLAQKRLDYSEEQAAYDMAFSQETTRDRGARVVRPRMSSISGANLSWPWPLG